MKPGAHAVRQARQRAERERAAAPPEMLLQIIESTTSPGALSVRLVGSFSGTEFKRALAAAGFRAGDVCKLAKVSK